MEKGRNRINPEATVIVRKTPCIINHASYQHVKVNAEFIIWKRELQFGDEIKIGDKAMYLDFLLTEEFITIEDEIIEVSDEDD